MSSSIKDPDGYGTLTIRLIRSFEYRNIRNVVYHNINLSQLVKTFIEFVQNDISNKTELPPPFRKYKYNTTKIEHKKFGAKTNDPAISIYNDEELMLHEDKSLAECGVEDETSISFFILDDYRKYQNNPQLLW